MKENAPQAIFDKNTVEFVTVAAEFCGFLERASEMKRGRFVDVSLKLLPLLYLKASLLPECIRMEEDDPETFVTEGDYERVRSAVATLLAEHDDYLEVFLDDMAYSDTPIRQTISEGLADIYQPLKNFICVFRLGLSQTMNDSLVMCREEFAEFWGQRLVNVMRALHDVKYHRLVPEPEKEEEDGSALFNDNGTEEELYEGPTWGKTNKYKVSHMEFPATIDKQIIQDMPVESFTGKIFLIDSEEEARKAVERLDSHTLVGVDTETRPSFRKGVMHKVALLQVATPGECFLFRLNRIGLPDFLEDFLQNDVLKVGLSLKDDFFMLRRRNRKDPRQGNWVELQDYVARFGIQEKSLQKIYALLFGKKISKSQRLSNWEADVLSHSQMAYAATDAWACVRIFTYLENVKSKNQ